MHNSFVLVTYFPILLTLSDEIQASQVDQTITDQCNDENHAQLQEEQAMEVCEANTEQPTDIILEGTPDTTAYQQNEEALMSSEQQMLAEQQVMQVLPDEVQLEAVDGQTRNMILEATSDAGIQYVTEQITNENNEQETVQYIVSGIYSF